MQRLARQGVSVSNKELLENMQMMLELVTAHALEEPNAKREPLGSRFINDIVRVTVESCPPRPWFHRLHRRTRLDGAALGSKAGARALGRRAQQSASGEREPPDPLWV
jgi:hypothetical protein